MRDARSMRPDRDHGRRLGRGIGGRRRGVGLGRARGRDQRAAPLLASACRIALTDLGGRIALSIADDGVGGPSTPALRTGGLEGLRDRVVSAGGALVVEPSNVGFRLVATLPGGGS